MYLTCSTVAITTQRSLLMTHDISRIGGAQFLRANTLTIILIVLGAMPAHAADTWEGGQTAEVACRAKLDETGAYAFSHVEINGKVGHCFVKAKSGDGEPIYDTAVFKD